MIRNVALPMILFGGVDGGLLENALAPGGVVVGKVVQVLDKT